MSNPLLSVIITTYNREKYLGEAIESVLDSTFEHFEIIIVDDNSKDNSFAIAQSYSAKDKRIRVYKNEKNLGDYGNRNKAAEYAIGKYIKYVDADDRVYRFGLEVLTTQMENFPEAGWGLCSLQQDDNRIFPFVLTPREAYFRHYLATDKRIKAKQIFNKAPLSAIIRKDIFEKEGRFNDFRYFGDQDMWHRLARKHPVLLMQDGIVWWRGHDGQEQHVRNENRVFAIKTWNNVIGHLTHPECPLTSEEVRPIIRKFRNLQYRVLGSQLKQFNFKYAKEAFSEITRSS